MSDAAAVRTAIAVPVYEGTAHLPEALESLLGQTRSHDLGIVVVDDSRTDAPQEIVARYVERFPRLHYARNPRRLGMVGNYRRGFALARETFPGLERFAWASDHDVWHPRWHEALAAALDATPDAVAAYPLNWRIDEGGRVTRGPWRFDTADLDAPRARFDAALTGMSAGNMVYALFRADALAAAGVYRPVLAPDRLLLLELALRGRFVQVPEVLWYRRFSQVVSDDRQRAAFFPDGVPLTARLPTGLVHSAILARELVLRGAVPEVSRAEGLRDVAVHARYRALRPGKARRRRRKRRR